MPNIENLKKYKRIHMIGIGGISMSGIAVILINWGFEVSGSDRSDSEILHILDHAHIKTFVGHEAHHVENADCVVYTAAISPDNPELVRAKELGIPVIERSDFLGELTRCYENTIAVSGTHGKTTTTSLWPYVSWKLYKTQVCKLEHLLTNLMEIIELEIVKISLLKLVNMLRVS